MYSTQAKKPCAADFSRRAGEFGRRLPPGLTCSGLRVALAGLLLGGGLALAACGYRFSGGGQFPAGVQRIFVTIFENRTSEIGVENALASAVTGEFTTRSNAAAVAGSRKDADAVLAGVITSVRITSISRVAETVSTEARVVITVSARLTTTAGKDVWSATGVAATATYPVVQDDKQVTESNKNAALDEAANKVAENLYNRLVEEF